MTDKKVFNVQRFLEDLDIDETDYLFVYDKDGNPKTVHLPSYLEDNDLLPTSISATLELFYAYNQSKSNTIH